MKQSKSWKEKPTYEQIAEIKDELEERARGTMKYVTGNAIAIYCLSKGIDLPKLSFDEHMKLCEMYRLYLADCNVTSVVTDDYLAYQFLILLNRKDVARFIPVRDRDMKEIFRSYLSAIH
jgi:hypothetical protein